MKISSWFPRKKTQSTNKTNKTNKTNIEKQAHERFIRNVAHKIDLGSTSEFSPTSSLMINDLGDNIPQFVHRLFEVGNDYNQKMNRVCEYATVCKDNFTPSEGSFMVRSVLSHAVQDAKNDMRKISDSHPIVNIDIDTSVPVSQIIGYGPVITEILREIILNGLKHSLQDMVNVKVWSTANEMDTSVPLEFSVENSGILIAPEDIPHIFQPFTFTSSTEGNVRGKGVGLGMAMIKRMADLIGARISVNTTRESTSVVLSVECRHDGILKFNTIPLELTHERNDKDLGIDVNQSIKALVVDDSPVILKVFSNMLSQLEAESIVCSNPADALEIVKKEKFDVIFMDFIMPVMTGVACSQKIREGDTINKDTPIVVITGNMSSEIRHLTTYISKCTLVEKPPRLSFIKKILRELVEDAF